MDNALFNEDAEKQVLGVLLSDNDAFDSIADILRPGHFYYPIHQRIYDAIKSRINARQDASALSLSPFFSDPNDVPEGYLRGLSASYVTSVGIRDVAEVIVDLYKRRHILAACETTVSQVIPNSKNYEVTADAASESLQDKLHKLSESTSAAGFDSVENAIDEFLALTEAAYKSDKKIIGVPTGIDLLDEKLGGLHPSDLIILAGRPGMGKAQPLDAAIRTPSGWTTMGALRVGDSVLSIDGAPSCVAGIYPQGRRQVYRVTFSDGRSAECCGEHLWRVYYREWDGPRILSADKLRNMLTRNRYKKRLWIDLPSGDGTPEAELPIPPYALGALLGDGGLTGGSVRFSSPDQFVLDRLSAELGSELTLRFAQKYDYRIIQSEGSHRKGVFGVVPNGVKESMVSLGLWGCRSEDKFIPPAYLESSRQQRIQLLQGLLDTDGWVEKFGALRYATSSERLADDVIALVRSVGGMCSKRMKKTSYTYKGERRTGLPSYVINIQHESAHELISLPKKRERLLRAPRAKRRLTITSIEPTRETDVQCIAVTHPSRLYITNEWIVTHNTALATNFAVNAVKQGYSVGFFSLEMSKSQLWGRIVSAECKIPSEDMRRGVIDTEQMKAIIAKSNEMKQLKFYVNDTPAQSVMAVRAQAKKLKRQRGLDLVVIDYLQLMQGESKSEGRVNEVSEITRGLKCLAKELNVPVIALSQLSRQTEGRENKRPMLSDLRESGSIEQDADVVMFVYREEYYLQREKPSQKVDESDDRFFKKMSEWENRIAEARGKAEIILAKQRHGPLADIEVSFDGKFTHFDNLPTGNPFGRV